MHFEFVHFDSISFLFNLFGIEMINTFIRSRSFFENHTRFQTKLIDKIFTRFQTKTALACENIRFSSLFATGDVSRGGTSATQRQKFHTDDANQCLRNESGSHGVPNINLSNFACLLVGFGEVLCSPTNELQQNSNASSREDYIPEILTVLLEILRVYI